MNIDWYDKLFIKHRLEVKWESKWLTAAWKTTQQTKVKCLINGLFGSLRISNQIQYLIFSTSSKSTPCQVVWWVNLQRKRTQLCHSIRDMHNPEQRFIMRNHHRYTMGVTVLHHFRRMWCLWTTFGRKHFQENTYSFSRVELSRLLRLNHGGTLGYKCI